MPKGYTFDSSHGPGVGMSSAGSSGSGSSSNSSGSNFNSARDAITGIASNISNAVHTNTSQLGNSLREILSNPSTSAKSANVYDRFVSDYGIGFDMDDYYDRLLELADYNNEWSAAQAQKQMDYQTRSDQAAMAWSALEAQKSRDWTEKLSNSAHQREVKDLLSAGLNPILSANGGAWSGSGPSGQGFSSSGAMGDTDMNVGANFMSMVSGMITTARDLAITKMQTAQQQYNTDKQYAMAKLQAETSIYNNNSNIDANKAINALNRDADLRKAGISANATMAAAAANAGAITSAAATNAAAARYSADQSKEANKYRSDTDVTIQNLKNEQAKWDKQHSGKGYVGELRNGLELIGEFGQSLINGLSGDSNYTYTPGQYYTSE